MEDKKEPIFWLSRIPVKKSTHEWIVDQGNQKGRKTGHQAGLFLDDLACKHHNEAQYDERGAMWAWENYQRKEYIRAQARYVARQYVSRPNDDLYECLEELCSETEYSPQQVIEDVSGDPFSAAVLANKSETLLSRCTDWLAALMNDVGDDGISKSVISTLAKEAGFSESTLERAKRTINNNSKTPSIMSEREGVGWKWIVSK